MVLEGAVDDVDFLASILRAERAASKSSLYLTKNITLAASARCLLRQLLLEACWTEGDAWKTSPLGLVVEQPSCHKNLPCILVDITWQVPGQCFIISQFPFCSAASVNGYAVVRL